MDYKNWFIYAYPHTYGGLHGMYDYEVVTGISYAEACDEAMALAREVIENYRVDVYTEDDYREEFDIPEDQDVGDDYFDLLSEAIDEECDFEIYPVRDDVDIEEIYHANDEPTELIRKYCIVDYNI